MFSLVCCCMMACSSEDKKLGDPAEKTDAVETRGPLYTEVMALDSSHLIDYILPDLTIDSTLVPSNKSLQDQLFDFELYDRSISYELHERTLSSAVIEFSNFVNKDSILAGIATHLTSFNGTLYESPSFQNWVLPLNGRSLIEINVFPGDTLISIDIHRRSHI